MKAFLARLLDARRTLDAMILRGECKSDTQSRADSGAAFWRVHRRVPCVKAPASHRSINTTMAALCVELYNTQNDNEIRAFLGTQGWVNLDAFVTPVCSHHRQPLCKVRPEVT
ncbi:MAG: hypothetical protein DME22_12785 [Verrucomicrobia bacterium]|nr:MAG: hypothetical protein DME22_12785 [Verrucomicrobiota bacterium]PYK00475.1 MAG: hypothetical protein DME23_07055 [Verrucomicrobiota bacterium]